MSDADGGKGLQVTTHVTKEEVESMINQMQEQSLSSLSVHLSKLTPSGTATSSKPTNQGKSVHVQNDPDDCYDQDALLGEQEGLSYLANRSSVQAPSASRPSAPYLSAVTPSKQISEPMLSEEQIRKMIQGDVQASQTGLKGYFGLDLDSFSIVLGITLPENFKAPKFTLYDGNSNAQEHLRMYCKKMAPYADNDDLMIYTFQDSLTGPSLKWFGGLERSSMRNWRSLAEAFARHYAFIERLALTKEDLGKMSRKPQESIREFSKRWMLVADQVKPPLEDKEMANEFLCTLKPEYHEKLASHINYDIFEMMEAVERMEKGPRMSKPSDSTRDKKSNSKNVEDLVNALSVPVNSGPRNPNFEPRAPFNPPMHHPLPPSQNYQPRPPVQPRRFDPFPVSYAEVYQHLVVGGKIAPIPPGTYKNPRSFNPNARCIYHNGQIGHDVKNCIPLKYRVQDLIKKKKLVFSSSEG